MKPPVFVFVHGAWHGGWCWSRVSPLLRRAGYEVYTPTLTGLGERSHLIDVVDVTPETFVKDIVNVILFEELENVVLVGHSASGIGTYVITCCLKQF